MSDTHAETALKIAYVRTEEAPLLPPPPSEVGFFGFIKQNLLASMSDFSSVRAAISSLVMIIATVMIVWFFGSTLWDLVNFALIDAVWTDPNDERRLACATTLQGGTKPESWFGACWPFIADKEKLLIYGRYPVEELWRVDTTYALLAGGVAWLTANAVGYRRIVGVAMLALAAVFYLWVGGDLAAANGPMEMLAALPLGTILLGIIGVLYLVLPSEPPMKLMSFLMVAVFPIVVFILLTGGDLERSPSFWATLMTIAGFALLVWLLSTILPAGSLLTLLLSLLFVVPGLWLIADGLGIFPALGGYDPFESFGPGVLTSFALSVGVPTGGFGIVTCLAGAAILLYAMAGPAIHALMKLAMVVGGILLLISGYGAGETAALPLPVGWILFAMIAAGFLAFAVMTFTSLADREWAAAFKAFGASAMKQVFWGAVVVGLVAFVGGSYFVDLVELTAAGQPERFLTGEVLAGTAKIPRETWPLPTVETDLWGGLLVTLVVALTGIVASLPLGVLLALGRRSRLPAVRLLSVAYIEFWRGVPLITVLFMSSVMLPLFLPDGVEFNKLLRALIGVALFASAYMAEVVRGGLQAIPKGQYEGADSLGLSYGQKMKMIVLPQALTLVIPGIVNTFIGLFKDTTLVLIIGLFDLLGMIRFVQTDASWSTPVQQPTGFLVAALVFGLFCFGMSRYSMVIERKLRAGRSR